MNYATVLAQNVDKSDVDGLEAAVVAPMENEQRIDSGNWKDSIHMTGEKASTACRKLRNYFSEIPGKIKYKEEEDYNAFVIPLLLLAGISIPAGITVGVALGAYALYKTRCPAVAMAML